MRKNKIEKLREKLHKEIESHGRDSPKVLEISKELDLHIVKEMKRRKNDIKKDLVINLK